MTVIEPGRKQMQFPERCVVLEYHTIQVQELNCSPSIIYILQNLFGLSDTDQYVTMMMHHFQEA